MWENIFKRKAKQEEPQRKEDPPVSPTATEPSTPGAEQWTAAGWLKIPAHTPPKTKEAVCPYSPDIRYSVTGDDTICFTGTGVLQGEMPFDPDDPDDPQSDGIYDFVNCIGERVRSVVDWGSIHYTSMGDIYNPNTWCTNVVVDASVTEIGVLAFCGFEGLKELTIKGKQTSITGSLPSDITIFAPPDSAAEAYAKQHEIRFIRIESE